MVSNTYLLEGQMDRPQTQVTLTVYHNAEHIPHCALYLEILEGKILHSGVF